MSAQESSIGFAPCKPDDFDAMLEIRIAAMRESLERLGRFDPERSRVRLEKSFYPQWSEFIARDGERIGFHTFRPAMDGFHLEHFYLLPAHQSQGIGSLVIHRLTARADAAALPIYLGALKESASNRFYERHGFLKNAESEWDIYYIRPPKLERQLGNT